MSAAEAAVRSGPRCVALDDKFQFGNVAVTGQIPVALGWWLLVRGGGGVSGFLHGEAGAKHLVLGNGEGGSLLVHALVGATGIIVAGHIYGASLVAGPSICLGFEWRI